MKSLKLIAIIGILAVALWVPAASASLITLTNADTLTLTLAGSPAITRSASASISGEAGYFPSETYSTGTASVDTTVAIPGGYTWLNTISATNAAGSTSNNFQGNGPSPSGSTPGYINETATTSQFYTFTTTHSSAKTGTFTAADVYSYSLSNATGNPFVDVTWSTQADLYLDGELVATSTPINVSQTAPDGQVLADIGPVSGVLTLTYDRPGSNKFSTGDHTFELRLTSFEEGHTSAVPIPGTVLLLGSGLVGLGLLGFRRRQNKS